MATTTLAPEDIEQLWHAFKADPESQELRNRLVETYLPLVKYNGERIWARLPDGVELDDLISVGVFGLMDAIDAFDMSRGVKFETYCVPRIRGAMLDELRSMDWCRVSCARRRASSTKRCGRSKRSSAALRPIKNFPGTWACRSRNSTSTCKRPTRSV